MNTNSDQNVIEYNNITFRRERNSEYPAEIASLIKQIEHDPKLFLFHKDDAINMALIYDTITSYAEEFIADLAREVRSGKYRPSKAFIKTLAAIVADLLRGARYSAKGLCYRSMSANSFSKISVGYTTFRSAIKALEQAGMIEVQLGNRIPGASGKSSAKQTRFKAKERLLKFALSKGITPKNWTRHFHKVGAPPSFPVLNRVSSSNRNGHRVAKGASMPIDLRDPVAKRLLGEMTYINDYIERQEIETNFSTRLQRLFNCGNDKNFDWNMGGRLYSLGSGFQQDKLERLKMNINGEDVVEIDIKACFPTIIHGLLSIPFVAGADVYHVPDVPRDVVKWWVTKSLGSGTFPSRCAAEHKKKYMEDHGIDLQKAYPISRMKNLIPRYLPWMDQWAKSAIRWPRLFYVESCIITECLIKLANEHNVCALPVHDSLIVPRSKSGIVESVLTDLFERRVGIRPTLSKKESASVNEMDL